MAQYRDLAAFAQFGSELDRATQEQLDRGTRLTEILKQPQYEPMPVTDQIMIIYAGTRGYLDDVKVERVNEWQDAFLQYVGTQHPEIAENLRDGWRLTDEIEEELKAAILEFKAGWT
jgi:F-type H+-transporting ATPase subunit alpha